MKHYLAMNTNNTPALDACQQNAFDRIKANPDKNFFIQGQAGTGKSTLINYIRENLGRTVAVVAPTGIAAQLIGGSTIHRMFHLGAHGYFPDNVVERYQGYESVVPLLDTLIIDEASMLRADVLDTVNVLCKRAKGNNAVFGGIQVILVGDLYQLPPVYKDKVEVLNYMRDKYQVSKPFFFDAACYQEGHFEKLELKQVHRQDKDSQFLLDLQAVCQGHAVGNETALLSALDSLNERVEVDAARGEFPIVTARKDHAEQINSERLAGLAGKERIYVGTLEGDYKETEAMVPQELHLKVGAKVMFCRNDTQEQKYVNGTMGPVIALDDEVITVQTEQGIIADVCCATWDKQEYVPSQQVSGALELRKIGSYTQFPLKLAYAITIHKSQGQTWDNVCIDLGRSGAFAEGQTYVALSRVKTKNGVHLARALSCGDVRTNHRVQQFLETGIRPQPVVPQMRDWESMKDFWSGIIRRLTAADAKCRCCSGPKLVRLLNGSPRFGGACYWFSCETQEVEQPLFLICVDNRTSALFEIPAHTFELGQLKLDCSIQSRDPRHHDPDYKYTHFDLFLETGGDYMELRTGEKFGAYLLATETDFNITMVKEDETDS